MRHETEHKSSAQSDEAREFPDGNDGTEMVAEPGDIISLPSA